MTVASGKSASIQARTKKHPHRLELCVGGLVARVLVGVVLDGELAIGFLYLELCGVRLDTKSIVVFGLFDHGCCRRWRESASGGVC